MAYQEGDTIVAVATPPGKGAISVIRLSGSRTAGLVRHHFRSSSPWSARSARPGRFLDRNGQVLDHVLVTFFQAPASYTGEDVAEISAHGNPVIVEHILGSLLQKGVRVARPGEFTERAFLNGKMDLAQAEAVRDLIESQTRFQAQLSRQQMEGVLSRRLEPLKQDWIRIMSHMETSLEFVEEDIDPDTRQQLSRELEDLDTELGGLEKSFQLGRLTREGLVVAVTGRPNAGKSSVFNSLLEQNRAIVAPLPGTTRDAVAEIVDLGGLPTRLVDTAGIRTTRDTVERLGVQRSMDALQECDLVLWVVDGSAAFDREDRRIWELLQGRAFVLATNKEDLPRRVVVPPEVEAACVGKVELSALHGTHVEDLKNALWEAAVPAGSFESERVMITSIRHKRCLTKARGHLSRGLVGYGKGLSEEFTLYDLKKGLEALGEITGEMGIEDLLDEIFSTFCIGK